MSASSAAAKPRKARGNPLNRRTAFHYINAFFMIVLAFITLYPLYFIIINSLNDPVDALKGGIYFWVREFSLANYEYFFSDHSIVRAFGVTVARTIFGTSTSVLFTAMFAYALSKKELVGRKLWMWVMLIPMYIGGGLVPYYLTIMKLGLMGNFLVFIIPQLFSAYNAIILMTHFRSLPKELEESAKIDGANDFYIFARIVLPLSGAVLATMALFTAVGHWQAWFDATLYGQGKYETIQGILVNIIKSSEMQIGGMEGVGSMNRVTAEGVKLTAMVVSTVPIALVYPFVQKYFVKGVMVGSIKG